MLKQTTVDLYSVDADGDGVVWSLPHGGDLDANLVHLASGAEMGAHVNDEVDVLFIGVDGVGAVTVDGTRHDFRGGTLVAAPRGAERHIAAGPSTKLVYLTVHVARPGLRIQTNRRDA
jgi:quercetin dioxygenase-like cupin family protein